MPCIFCVAVFAMLAGAVTVAVLDELEERLKSVAADEITRTADTASVTRFEFTVTVPAGAALPAGAPRTAPVAVTVYKKQKRVRIQVLTHALPREVDEAIEDLIAAAAGLDILSREDAHAEDDDHDHPQAHDDEEAAAAAETTSRSARDTQR
jgi:hypothetical protein